MIIREAKVVDYKSICLLNQEGFNISVSQETTHQRIIEILKMPTDKIFVAEVDNKLVGYIHVSSYECTYYESLKSIVGLIVDKQFQRKGIARSLLETAEEWAKKQCAKGIWLVSGYDRVGAHEFYINSGYAMRKEQKNFIKWF